MGGRDHSEKALIRSQSRETMSWAIETHHWRIRKCGHSLLLALLRL
jgi:hypothetical protein